MVQACGPRRGRPPAAALVGAVVAAAVCWGGTVGPACGQGAGSPAPGGAAVAMPPPPPAAATQASRRPGSEFWFDPTQLPSFTGTVERYLLNPRGETDALLFREGPQVVFPPDVADAVRQAAAPGRPIVVWGIRARGAPVITMLAFAPTSDANPVVVERLYWRLLGRQPAEQTERLAVAGTVKQPYYSPQGEVAGAILDDGTVVLLPQGAAGADGMRDLLRAGAKLAAEGPGATAPAGANPAPPPAGPPPSGPAPGGAAPGGAAPGGAAPGGAASVAGQGAPMRALLADRVGEDAGALRPVPRPAPPAQAPAPSR